MNRLFEVFETNEHGLALKVFDPELADQLDDYLTERRYVLYNIGFGRSHVEFYFGEVGDPARLRPILNAFCEELGLDTEG